MPASLLRLALTLGFACCLLVVPRDDTAPPVGAATLPSGFTDSLVVSVSAPTSFAFTPDGRLLVTSQAGRLHVVQNGTLLAVPALDLSAKLCSNGERGLLGIAVDPAFPSNQRLYLYYTLKRGASCPTGTSGSELPVNRISRFTLGSDNIVDPASEQVIVDNIFSLRGNHNGGDLQFGADGFLYASVGESGVSSNAQTLENLSGKVLRVTTDGAAAPSNPYIASVGARRCGDPAGVPAGTGPCQEIFAHGLRNPFRIAFKPGTSEFFINDVGQGTWEEIDEGKAGANYGWPGREGGCTAGSSADCPPPPTGVTDPIYFYGRGEGCGTITGGAFVPSGTWPAEYQGSYLFADFLCGRIFRLIGQPGGGFSAVDFAADLGTASAIHLSFGPSNLGPALYYTTYSGDGQVRVIEAASPFTPTSFVRLPVALLGQP